MDARWRSDQHSGRSSWYLGPSDWDPTGCTHTLHQESVRTSQKQQHVNAATDPVSARGGVVNSAITDHVIIRRVVPPARLYMDDRQTGSSAAALVVPVVDCFTCQNVIEDASKCEEPVQVDSA